MIDTGNRQSQVQLLVVIVNYNTGEWLSRCLSALDRQTLPDSISQSISVVDNHSSDESLHYLKSLTDDSRIKITFNQHNIGFAAACNQVATAESFDYILLLNPDCEVNPDSIEQVIDSLENYPQAGIAGVRVNDLDGQEQRASRRRLPTPVRSMITMLGLERLGLKGVNIRSKPVSTVQQVEAVSGAFLMIRSACWQQLSGMDSAYFLHCEDLDLFTRALNSGWQILYCPAISVVHAKGVSQRSARLVSERHKRDSMLRYYDQHLAASSLWLTRTLWPLLLRLRYRLQSLLWREK